MRPHGVLLLACLCLLLVAPGLAQGQSPSISAADQVILDGNVSVTVSDPAPAIAAVQADAGGQPGDVIGYAAVDAGTYNWQIPINPVLATPALYLSLYADSGQTLTTSPTGVVSGLENPLATSAPFTDVILNSRDQFLSNFTFTVDSVTMPQPGLLVIQADHDGAPNGVLGSASLPAGTTTNIPIDLSQTVGFTSVWVKVVATNSPSDPPMTAGDGTAQEKIFISPHIDIQPQLVLFSNAVQASGRLTLIISSVLAQFPGLVTINTNTSDFSQIGAVPVPAGYSPSILVPLSVTDPSQISTILWASLSDPTGAPLFLDRQLLSWPVIVGPSITASSPSLADPSASAEVRWPLDRLLMSAPGYAVIGCVTNPPGASVLLVTVPLHTGLNPKVVQQFDTSPCSTLAPPFQLQVALYTGVAPNGSPVLVNGHPAAKTVDLPTAATPTPTPAPPTAIASVETAGTPEPATAAVGVEATAVLIPCTVVPGGNSVNLYQVPSTNAPVFDHFPPGVDPRTAVAQFLGSSNHIWYQLSHGLWVRADGLITSGDCTSLPVIVPTS